MLDCAKFEFLTISFDNMTLRRKTNWMRNETKSSKLYAQLGKSNYANSHWTKFAREISTTKKQQSHTFVKVAGDRFRSTVCIYEKSTHEVRWLIPKMHEIFTNRLRNVSASVIARAKRCLVKYTIFQRIVLSAWSGDNSPWMKITISNTVALLRFVRSVRIVNLAYGPYAEVIRTVHLIITKKHRVTLRTIRTDLCLRSVSFFSHPPFNNTDRASHYQKRAQTLRTDRKPC